jgi:hypothetical protein
LTVNAQQLLGEAGEGIQTIDVRAARQFKVFADEFHAEVNRRGSSNAQPEP